MNHLNRLGKLGRIGGSSSGGSGLYTMLLTSTGTGAGVSTLRMQVSAPIILSLGANAKFYSDAGGTADESSTWTITSGALRTIYLKCTTGTATMTFSDITKVIRWGNGIDNGWASSTNAAFITAVLPSIVNLINLKMTGASYLSGVIPAGLIYLYIDGINISWTGLGVSGNGDMTMFSLLNHRVEKMSSADMIILLTSLTNRVGALPATITINDYADYASPPVGVTDAVAALKAAKSITTVNLGL